MSIRTLEEVRERTVVWRPKGYIDPVAAEVRNGEAHIEGLCGEYLVNDLDGCIEFINAIKEAIEDTKKPW